MTVLFYILCVLTFGVLPLLCHWYPSIKLYMTHFKSDNRNASSILLRSSLSKQVSVVDVNDVQIMTETGYTSARVYKYRNVTFIYDPRRDCYCRVAFNCSRSFTEIVSEMSSGMSTPVRIIRKTLFGSNGINIVVKNPIALLLDEVS